MRRPPRAAARRTVRLVTVLAALAAGAALVIPPQPAAAAHGVQFGLTDDAWLQSGPGTLDSRLSRLQALGVRVVRFGLRWDAIATSRPTTPSDPTDEAYDWTNADAVLTGLHARGIGVVLQLYGTPAWANGGRPPNYAPSSGSAFASFARAAATRYSWIKRWLIWNEPNQVRWLRPTSAAVYTRRLLNPAYTAIHAAIPDAQVGGGGTAPRGSTGGVAPVAFIAGMSAAHARLDAYAHNPYPLSPKSETPLRNGCSHCATITMATLGTLVRLVERDFGSARIWLSEYGYQTNPPDRLLGVSPALQARYLAEGAYQAWRTPRVDLLIQFLYRDEPTLARFQSGLVTLRNRAKPAYVAFQLPLAEIQRAGARVTLWGQVRAPAAKGLPLAIERLTANGWTPLASRQAGAGGYLRWTGTVPPGAKVRLRAGTHTGATLTVW